MKREGVPVNWVPPHSLSIPHHSHSSTVEALRFSILVSDVPSPRIVRQDGSALHEPNRPGGGLDVPLSLFVVPIHNQDLLLLADGFASPLGNGVANPRLLW